MSTITKGAPADPKVNPYGVITSVMVLDERLTRTDFHIAAFIITQHPDWEITIVKVSKMMKIDRKQVTLSFDRLEACGYMSADRNAFGRVNIRLSNYQEFTPYEHVKPAKPAKAKPHPAPTPEPEATPEPEPVVAKPAQTGEYNPWLDDSAEGAQACIDLMRQKLVFNFNPRDVEEANRLVKPIRKGCFTGARASQ